MSIKISVDKGDKFGAKVVQTSTTTGQEFKAYEVKAGKSVTIDDEPETKVTVMRGDPSPEADEADTKAETAKA